MIKKKTSHQVEVQESIDNWLQSNSSHQSNSSRQIWHQASA